MSPDHGEEVARGGRCERKAERIEIDAQVALRRSGQPNYRVRAYDVTHLGCKLEFVERPVLDERVWVKFDRLEAVEGQVCWVNGHVAGIEFTRELHPAVFAMLLARLR